MFLIGKLVYLMHQRVLFSIRLQHPIKVTRIKPYEQILKLETILNQISTKFGFSTGPVIPEPEIPPPQHDSNSDRSVERDVGLLYEKSYKLYGKSLAILPEDKRGCLPNYNKYYHSIDGTPFSSAVVASGSSSPSQLEDDSADPNSISITNDAMGNLLINDSKRRALHTAPNAEVVNHKAGPLKKIKNILIIGVHGFFPTRMIRPIIGAPKGTSLKFANEAEKAIIRYCLENDLINEYESKVSIQKIALEEKERFLIELSSSPRFYKMGKRIKQCRFYLCRLAFPRLCCFHNIVG